MKLRYDKDDDVLMVWFSKDHIDYAEKEKNIIVHFSKTNKPVLIEILEASSFLEKTSKILPQDMKHHFFA